MDLKQKLLAGTFVFAMLNGCSTVNEVNREFPKGHISGVEYKTLNQSAVPYKLENHFLFDIRYYLQETAGTQENLPMLFYLADENVRDLDLDSKELNLNPRKMYLPRLVEGETKGKKDKWLDGVNLENKGIYGTRAYFPSLEELKKRKESSNSVGYKVITTEDDATFFLPFEKILGENYFIVKVEDKKLEAEKKDKKTDKLSFYMIPLKGARVWIDEKCGNISIYNKNKVYRAIFVTESELQESILKTQGTFMDDILLYQEQNPTPCPTSAPTPTPKPSKKKN